MCRVKKFGGKGSAPDSEICSYTLTAAANELFIAVVVAHWTYFDINNMRINDLSSERC